MTYIYHVHAVTHLEYLYRLHLLDTWQKPNQSDKFDQILKEI